jgi:hypothetical protein
VESLVSEGWRVPGALGPADVVGPFVDGWADITGQRCDFERRLRAYELRSVKTAAPERGRLRLAAAADLERVAEWRYRFDQAIFGAADRGEARQAAERGIKGSDIYLWEEDGPVSMALKTRPARDGISVSAVYTPPELRGRGYATACVGELSRLLVASGWAYCTLFVDVTNAAAERVYRKVGYEPVCDFDEVVFLSETPRSNRPS